MTDPALVSARNPQVAVEDSGAALLAWPQAPNGSNQDVLQVATRAPGGLFGAGKPVSRGTEDANGYDLAANRIVDAVVVWESIVGGIPQIEAASDRRAAPSAPFPMSALPTTPRSCPASPSRRGEHRGGLEAQGGCQAGHCGSHGRRGCPARAAHALALRSGHQQPVSGRQPGATGSPCGRATPALTTSCRARASTAPARRSPGSALPASPRQAWRRPSHHRARCVVAGKPADLGASATAQTPKATLSSTCSAGLAPTRRRSPRTTRPATAPQASRARSPWEQPRLTSRL